MSLKTDAATELTDNRTLYRSLVRLAIPIMLNNLLQMLLNLADDVSEAKDLAGEYEALHDHPLFVM